MIERSAVILKAKDAFRQWILDSDQDGELEGLELADLEDDRNVYLLDPEELEDPDSWLDRNCSTLLEFELEDWTLDRDLWPDVLDRKQFDLFFELLPHSVVIDTVGGEIAADDEIEAPEEG